MVAEGGADADVAAAIAATKSIGAPTVGDVDVDVPHAQGFDIPISFRRVKAVPLQITVELTAGMGFPATGLVTIRANLVDWFAGTWVPGPGVFDQGGVGIGETLDTNRLLSPINAVPGHMVGSVVVTRVLAGAALGMPDLDERYTLAAGGITLNLA